MADVQQPDTAGGSIAMYAGVAGAVLVVVIAVVAVGYWLRPQSFASSGRAGINLANAVDDDEQGLGKAFSIHEASAASQTQDDDPYGL